MKEKPSCFISDERGLNLRLRKLSSAESRECSFNPVMALVMQLILALNQSRYRKCR